MFFTFIKTPKRRHFCHETVAKFTLIDLVFSTGILKGNKCSWKCIFILLLWLQKGFQLRPNPTGSTIARSGSRDKIPVAFPLVYDPALIPLLGNTVLLGNCGVWAPFALPLDFWSPINPKGLLDPALIQLPSRIKIARSDPDRPRVLLKLVSLWSP